MRAQRYMNNHHMTTLCILGCSQMSNRVLVVDPEACTGCRACMVACSSIKDRVHGLKQSRLWIQKKEVTCSSVPVICRQCANAPCESVCPTGAISRNPETGAYVVVSNECTGCEECVRACPFGAITVRKGLAVKCDLCEGDPECAKTCTPGTIKYEYLATERLKKK